MRSLLILGLTLVVSAGAHAAVLYDLSPLEIDTAFASDSVPDQFNNQQLAEAFVLSGPASVESLEWWGRSENTQFSDLRNMETFTLEIYDDAGATPGDLLFSATLPTADLNPTEVATDSSGVPIYAFDYGLGSALSLSKGTYWFSVGSDNFDPDGDGFYWSSTTIRKSGDFVAQLPVDDIWGSTGFADLSLRVNGSPVPEPATLVGIGCGLAALMRRRRGLR